MNEEFHSDSQASRILYGTNDLGKGYRNLKSRLEKRALNTIFFLDLNSPSYNDLQKAHYNCYKNLAASKILLGRGARKSSIKLSEKTLSIALKFEFYDIAIPLLQDLRNHYGSLLGNQKKLKKYNGILKKLKKDRDYEELAREISTLPNLPFHKSLRRIRNTQTQTRLGRNERLKNLKNAFKLHKIPSHFRSAILVDDVFTTGSTADACAAELKKHAPQLENIVVLTALRG